MLTEKIYDVCIVGGGTSGSILASALSKKGFQVIVIEAGSKFEFSDRSQQMKRYEILGEKLWPWELDQRDGFTDSSITGLGYSYELNSHRVKGVGGTSLHWGGLSQRLRPSDFKVQTLYGQGLDWPISYDELEPYYSQAEWEIGVSGSQNASDPFRSRPYPMKGFEPGYDDQIWLQAAKKLNISTDKVSFAINSEPYKNRSQCLAFARCNLCLSGARFSGDFQMSEAVSTGNCDLLTTTVVRQIDVDGSGNVKEIHATTTDYKEYNIKAKSYVITAHAVETARLMLLSGIGNESDQVGRNLMEHWYVSAGGYIDNQTFPGRIGFHTLESSHFYDGKERADRGAIKLEFGYFNWEPLDSFDADKLWGPDIAKYDCENFGKGISIWAETEQQPNPLSRVTLSENKKDMFGDPVPHINFALSDVDLTTQKKAKAIISQVLEAAGVKDIKHDNRLNEASHHMGTCRMSIDPNMGVVDKDCRVHGIQNLFLVGSSVFPTSGARQPTLTIVALALRLADRLSEQLKS